MENLGRKPKGHDLRKKLCENGVERPPIHFNSKLIYEVMSIGIIGESWVFLGISKDDERREAGGVNN